MCIRDRVDFCFQIISITKILPLHFAQRQDFACGIPLRSRPQNGSNYAFTKLPIYQILCGDRLHSPQREQTSRIGGMTA